jgi:hypothetical protein
MNQVIEPLQGHDAPKTSKLGTYLWFHKKVFQADDYRIQWPFKVRSNGYQS